MKLCTANADQLSPEVARFSYNRDAQAVGIVHFGIGAFHRAHQAWYTDAAMNAGDRDWAITGVSLRSPSVAEQMNPQDGLYTVTECSASGPSTRLVGAVREVLVAERSRARVAISLIAPSTRIVSLTVTEKGYCRAPDGSLDQALASAGSFYPLLLDAFEQRKAAGIEGLTLLSCDNLAGNGKQLARLIGDYIKAHKPELLDWFEAECACPSSMVDRIVPATTATDRHELAARIGLSDDAAVMTEPFSQWVIEDRFVGPRPRWENVGAELVDDVAPYELAKLRMLNGAHSLLAYMGLQRGHTYVHQAIADPQLRALVEQLMLHEAAPTLTPAPGQDLTAYANALIERFANPALRHRLHQIAMDGSQKIPQRWLATLAARQAHNETCPAIVTGIAAWIAHLRGANGVVDDPMAEELLTAVATSDPLSALFGPTGVFAADWVYRSNS